jgi:hypothetical protein
MIYLDEKKRKKEKKSDLFTRGFQCFIYIYIVEKYETVIKLVV